MTTSIRWIGDLCCLDGQVWGTSSRTLDPVYIGLEAEILPMLNGEVPVDIEIHDEALAIIKKALKEKPIELESRASRSSVRRGRCVRSVTR